MVPSQDPRTDPGLARAREDASDGTEHPAAAARCRIDRLRRQPELTAAAVRAAADDAVDAVARQYRVRPDPALRDEVIAAITAGLRGLGPIQPLMDDPESPRS